MGTLGVHQNIPASDTKLTHSLGIYSIGPPLVMDKLIPVISRAITSPPEMGPLLDVECKPAVIIKPRFNDDFYDYLITSPPFTITGAALAAMALFNFFLEQLTQTVNCVTLIEHMETSIPGWLAET